MIEIIFASLAWKAFGQNMWEKLNEAFSTDELTITASGEDVDAERETVPTEGNDTLPTNSRYNTEDDDEYLTED